MDINKCLHYLPLSVLLVVFVTFIVTYIMSVLHGHVSPFFPYISDTGTVLPENCIFSQGLNLAALLLLGSIYMRYHHVKLSIEVTGRSIPFWCNLASACLGTGSAVGLSILGNFHKNAVNAVHVFGVFLCFIFGGFYLLIQTHFSRKLRPILTTRTLYLFRVHILWLICVTIITLSVGALIAERDFNAEDSLHWKQEDGGWEMHLLSTFSQWICVLLSNMFLATFTWDFRRSEFKMSPKTSIKKNFNAQSTNDRKSPKKEEKKSRDRKVSKQDSGSSSQELSQDKKHLESRDSETFVRNIDYDSEKSLSSISHENEMKLKPRNKSLKSRWNSRTPSPPSTSTTQPNDADESDKTRKRSSVSSKRLGSAFSKFSSENKRIDEEKDQSVD